MRYAANRLAKQGHKSFVALDASRPAEISEHGNNETLVIIVIAAQGRDDLFHNEFSLKDVQKMEMLRACEKVIRCSTCRITAGTALALSCPIIGGDAATQVVASAELRVKTTQERPSINVR